MLYNRELKKMYLCLKFYHDLWNIIILIVGENFKYQISMLYDY